MEPGTVQVVLQGKTFVLRTSEDPADLQSIVDYVNHRLDEISASGNLPAQSVALLAALSLAQELLKDRQALQNIRDKIRVKSALILDMLDVSANSGDNPPAGGMSI